MPLSITYNQDCMDYLRSCKDKQFDLAIVDPPFFEGVGKEGFYGKGLSGTGRKRGVYKTINNWNAQIPTSEYFEQLKRISHNQIIWGINYYEFSGCTGRVIWDKVNDESTFSDAEIASCSIIKHVKIFRYKWHGFLQGDMKNKEKKIHPTQKPIALYKWLLQNYAKAGDTILDTHLGSGSSRIAAYEMGFDFTGIELDKDYYETQEKRFADHLLTRPALFDAPIPKAEQSDLFAA